MNIRFPFSKGLHQRKFILLFLVGTALGASCGTAAEKKSPKTNPTAASAIRTKTSVPQADKTFLQVLVEGGFVMIPLAVCSALTVALISDALIRIRNSKAAPPPILARIREAFGAGDYEQAYQICKSHSCILTNVLRNGLSMLGEGKQSVDQTLLESLTKENTQIQTRISYLSVIGVVTPMIGLLGTVVGMIKAFSTLGSSGIGDPSTLASAIGEVLVATASGLFIAIPAFGAFYFFRNRMAAVTMHVEDSLNGLFRRIPYADLAGMQIGDEPVYAASPRRSSDLSSDPRISRRISVVVPCPTCNSHVAAGSPMCPTCNTPLEWR